MKNFFFIARETGKNSNWRTSTASPRQEKAIFAIVIFFPFRESLLKIVVSFSSLVDILSHHFFLFEAHFSSLACHLLLEDVKHKSFRRFDVFMSRYTESIPKTNMMNSREMCQSLSWIYNMKKNYVFQFWSKSQQKILFYSIFIPKREKHALQRTEFSCLSKKEERSFASLSWFCIRFPFSSCTLLRL